MRSSRRTILAVMLGAVASLAGVSGPAAADAYPSKPIRLVVPFPAGGTTDILARARWRPSCPASPGWNVVVDNRPGAGGNIGADLGVQGTARRLHAADGHRRHARHQPVALRQLPFDPVKDFAPITEVAAVPNVLVVNPAFAQQNQINTVNDLIAYARAHPGS